MCILTGLRLACLKRLSEVLSVCFAAETFRIALRDVKYRGQQGLRSNRGVSGE